MRHSPSLSSSSGSADSPTTATAASHSTGSETTQTAPIASTEAKNVTVVESGSHSNLLAAGSGSERSQSPSTTPPSSLQSSLADVKIANVTCIAGPTTAASSTATDALAPISPTTKPPSNNPPSIQLAPNQVLDVAIKKVNFVQQESEQSSVAVQAMLVELRREMLIQRQLVHPNFVQLYGVCVAPLAMILELVPHGELYSLIHNHSGRHLPWTFLQRAARELATGLQFMHSKKIAHLDLKSPNIMIGNLDWCPLTSHLPQSGVAMVGIDAQHNASPIIVSPRSGASSAMPFSLRSGASSVASTTTPHGAQSRSELSASASNGATSQPSYTPSTKPIIKIADFGMSKEISTFITGRFVANPIWLAPEILMNHRYDLRVDVYAFGIILWELLTREALFSDIPYMNEVEDFIMLGKRPPLPERRFNPPEFEAIITRCWHQDPNQRPSWDWIIEQIDALDVHRLETTVGVPFYQELLKKVESQKKQRLEEERRKQEKIARAQKAVEMLALRRQQDDRDIVLFFKEAAFLHLLPKDLVPTLEFYLAFCDAKENLERAESAQPSGVSVNDQFGQLTASGNDDVTFFESLSQLRRIAAMYFGIPYDADLNWIPDQVVSDGVVVFGGHKEKAAFHKSNIEAKINLNLDIALFELAANDAKEMLADYTFTRLGKNEQIVNQFSQFLSMRGVDPRDLTIYTRLCDPTRELEIEDSSESIERDPVHYVQYDGPLITAAQKQDLEPLVEEKQFEKYHAELLQCLQQALYKLFLEYAMNRATLEAKWEQESQSLLLGQQAIEGGSVNPEGESESAAREPTKKSHSRKESKGGLKSAFNKKIEADGNKEGSGSGSGSSLHVRKKDRHDSEKSNEDAIGDDKKKGLAKIFGSKKVKEKEKEKK